ncbi:MAG: FAD-dependent oxidoreductase [Acidobacteriota bacterium]
MTRFALFLIALTPIWAVQQFDVVVYGGTPGGVASAVSAARSGHSVALIEYHKHLGGMTTSGLGKSDIETREAIGGLFREFVGEVRRHYIEHYGASSENVKLARDGYYFEPSVAQRVIDRMVSAESRIKVYTYHRLEEAVREGNRLTAIRVLNRATNTVDEFRGRIFIDGTYEGDLLAFAGARYRLGRESRAEFNELHAGVVYQDHETRTFLAGTTGKGDKRITAYTYRLCLTTDPANSHVLRQPPPDYDRSRYLGYIDDWKAGRMGPPKVMKEGVGYFAPTFNTMVRVFSIAEIPNKKTDVNMNPRLPGFPFTEENYAYPEANWEQREKISEKIRNITLGLLYFIQNDEAIPAEHRKLANQYNLAKDEFADNDNFPFQLYVREARRLAGLYTLTENDTNVGPELGRTQVHQDSVAAGEFPIDSFPVRKHEKGHDLGLEGYIFMLDQMTKPYQIPYRIMIPETVDGLIVPVAASTTHIAFSTIRLEPTWMALGQAAGVAAHLAIESSVQPRAVNIDRLQREILKRNQVITYFKDIDHKDPAYAALQYFGAKGFFNDYQARSSELVDEETARKWWKIATGEAPPTNAAGGRTRGQLCNFLYEMTGAKTR